MTDIALNFKRVSQLPSSFEQGCVYFEDSTHLLYVAKTNSTVECYSGLRDVEWESSTNILRFTDANGSAVNIDFSEIVTEDMFSALLTSLGMVKKGNGYAFDANSTGIPDTSYLTNASTVKDALKALDAQIHAVSTAAGVVSIGGASGAITLQNGGTDNGDINLTMAGNQLQAAIVGLGTAAYTNSSAYDVSGAAATVQTTIMGTAGDPSTEKTIHGLDAKIDAIKSDSSLSISESAGSGDVLKVYTLTQGGTTVGNINIPKDFLVKSGEVKTVTTAGQPYSGAVVGDKYIDFVVNTYDTTSGSGTDTHIYIPVNDLVDAYDGSVGTTITVSVSNNNEISAEINTGSVSTTMLDTSVQTALNKANTAVQSVSGETAVANSSYVAVSVEASTNSTTNAVTLTSHANVTTHDVSTATNASDGLATAYDVQQYVQTYVGKMMRWAQFDN